MNLFNFLELEDKTEKRAEELVGELKEIDEFVNKYKSLSNYFKIKISEYGDLEAITDKYCKVELTYRELEVNISNFASGLQS